MWTTMHALLATDAGIRVACVLILAGWAVGALTVVLLGWRRLRAPSEAKMLRRHLEDCQAQVRGLLKQNARLADQLVAGDRERAGWRGKGAA